MPGRFNTYQQAVNLSPVPGILTISIHLLSTNRFQIDTVVMLESLMIEEDSLVMRHRQSLSVCCVHSRVKLRANRGAFGHTTNDLEHMHI